MYSAARSLAQPQERHEGNLGTKRWSGQVLAKLPVLLSVRGDGAAGITGCEHAGACGMLGACHDTGSRG